MARRPLLIGIGLLALLALVALPAIAADPPGKPKASKEPKTEEIDVTLTGTVSVATEADGGTTYTLASGGKTYTLHVGPAWYRGSDDPLKAYVGTSVTVKGRAASGSTDVDVLSIDGKVIRAEGKPPWAGGWKAVGQNHPGWSQAKADRFKAKFGSCFPPGHCKAPASPAP